MLLTIIVPVYKVEQTLDRCVKSILAQCVDSMEVILVDDGSPDHCPIMCDTWATADNRIRVIHKNNGGLSSARNAGLDIAQGEYITFVDSDDYLSPDTLQPLMTHLRQHPKIDILEFSINDQGTRHTHLTYPNRLYASAKEYWLQSEAWCHAYAWNKIYRNRLFHNVRFPEGRFYEDLLTLPLLLKANPTVETTALDGYNYCYNVNSITARPPRRRFMQLLWAEIIVAIRMRTHPFSSHGIELYRAMGYRIVDFVWSFSRLGG